MNSLAASVASPAFRIVGTSSAGFGTSTGTASAGFGPSTGTSSAGFGTSTGTSSAGFAARSTVTGGTFSCFGSASGTEALPARANATDATSISPSTASGMSAAN